jgi:hypothetical protein
MEKDQTSHTAGNKMADSDYIAVFLYLKSRIQFEGLKHSKAQQFNS